MAKRPAFQFYPGDWRKDVELRACSLAARGLWIDLMCVAHECEPYGHLMLNGKPMTLAKIAGQIGVPASQVKKLLDELLENGVARKTPQGVIYSKRMVDDERLRAIRAEGGKAGAEHGVKGGSHGVKGGRPSIVKGGLETPLQQDQNPPPSSSSASSTSKTILLQQQISNTWWPRAETILSLRMVNNFDEQWIEEQVPSFVAYWTDRWETPVSLDANFIDHCITRSKLRSVS